MQANNGKTDGDTLIENLSEERYVEFRVAFLRLIKSVGPGNEKEALLEMWAYAEVKLESDHNIANIDGIMTCKGCWLPHDKCACARTQLAVGTRS